MTRYSISLSNSLDDMSSLNGLSFHGETFNCGVKVTEICNTDTDNDPLHQFSFSITCFVTTFNLCRNAVKRIKLKKIITDKNW